MSGTLVTPHMTPATQEQRHEEWQRLEGHHRRNLMEATQNQLLLEVNTLEDLQGIVADLYGRNTGREQEESQLQHALDHLKSFASAITSASQYNPVACLVWGGIQAILQSADQHKQLSEEVVEMVTDLNNSIGSLQGCDNGLIQGHPGMQYALQEMFADFMNYCEHASAYFSRTYYGNILLNIFSSKPRRVLDTTRKRIHGNAERLRRFVRENTNSANVENARILQALPAGIADMPEAADAPLQDVVAKFPVTTVDKSRNSSFVGREDLLGEIVTAVERVQPAESANGSEETAASQSEHRSAASPDIVNGDSTRGLGGAGSTQTATASKKSLQTFKPAVCVLTGLGGIGKTQMAVEFYYRHRGEYDASFWVEAERDWTLASSYAQVADKLGLLPTKSTDSGGHNIQSKAIEESRKWLQTTNRRWLMIFDNVEDFRDLDRYLPYESRCNATVIITTQQPTIPSWLANTTTISVKEFDRETAGKCIFEYLEREETDADELEIASQLADHVGRLPLAMATIGGYLKRSEMSLAEFFEHIQHSASLWRRAPNIDETQSYARSLESVFTKAFADLKPPSRELLNVLAFLDPDSIPLDILENAIAEKAFEHIDSKYALDDCYWELRSRQLIRRDRSATGPYLSIHRVVQWNVLLDLTEDQEHRWQVFQQAFDIVKKMLPKTSPLAEPEPEVWPPYAKHGRQILELRTHCLWPEPKVDLPVEFAQILSDMGTYMWFSGKFPEGEEALNTAEDIMDADKAPREHPLRASLYVMHGVITSFEGVSQREHSFELRKLAYESRMDLLGKKPKVKRTREEDMLIFNVLSDMAFGEIQQENFDKVEEIMQKCLAQYKSWEADEMMIPFEYSKYYQLIAFCHMAAHRRVDAIEAIARCHELMQAAAGDGHPMAQLIKFCHANLLWHSQVEEGQQKALDINKAVLEHRRKLLGEFSHFTLESYSTCGKLCEESGELEKAREYLDTCLQRRKRAVWNEEGVARAQFRYARVLRKLADVDRTKSDANPARGDKLREDAENREKEVEKVIRRYRKDYPQYLPQSEDPEANLDQMVSFWSGRYTGQLKQPDMEPQGSIPDLSTRDLNLSSSNIPEADSPDTSFMDSTEFSTPEQQPVDEV
ncbi:hypothetical protein H2200_010277 [Cladophialophora chaetospira]|uniref:NB-ARC domain-containing protein n=1 Tax=Cladophialophora chaetospira TaxID=386627 RepID=A0AA38X185_9EURO|nr:hypothetical protein H2200_010277 [Cladophialophora chaetospira]